MKEGTVLDRHIFVFNPQDNGGESLVLKTEFIANGDEGADDFYFTNHKLTLQSYCNEASFSLLSFAITPEKLRKLADELEAVENRVKKEHVPNHTRA